MRNYNDQPRFVITPDVLRLVAALDEFKGQWLAFRNMPAESLGAMEQQAITQGTAAGIRLGGGDVTDRQVTEILTGADEAPKAETSSVVAYAKVLRMLTSSYASIPFSELHIKQLHGVLAAPGDGDKHGEYRQDGDGNIAEEMHNLVAWTETALDEGRLHPLLVIAYFMLGFLDIRPFAQDNQRLVRHLVFLLMLKKGYDFMRCYALAAVLEEEQSLFQQGLEEGLQRLRSDNVIDEAWLLAFGQILRRQTRHVRDVLVGVRRTAGRHGLEQEILKHVRSHGQTTNKLIQSATGANRNTIKVHLRKLVDTGELVRHGTGKGSCYTLGAVSFF